MPELFDMKARAMRRDRAARIGPELFLLERAFEDCLERIAPVQRQFGQALLIGCPDPSWRERVRRFAEHVDVCDPGSLYADRAGGATLTEDAWQPDENAYDLVLAVGTLDTVNELPVALRLVRYALAADGLFLGAVAGGDTLPALRSAMRAADVLIGTAAPHVHPRIEAAALAPLLAEAGFVDPVVDIDRASVSYPSLERLIADLRGMGSTNVLSARPRFVGKAAREVAAATFRDAGDGNSTIETFEIIHFAGWAPKKG